MINQRLFYLIPVFVTLSIPAFCQSTFTKNEVILRKNNKSSTTLSEYGLANPPNKAQYVVPMNLDTSRIVIKLIDLQPKQSVYQQYLQKNISKYQMYEMLLRFGDTSTSGMFKDFLNTTVAILIYDSSNLRKFIVDGNNNKNFIDDSVYSINKDSLSQNSEAYKNKILVKASAQYFYKEKVYEINGEYFLQPYSRTIKYPSAIENTLFCSVSPITNTYTASWGFDSLVIENTLPIHVFHPNLSIISFYDSSSKGLKVEIGDTLISQRNIFLLDSVSSDFKSLFIRSGIPSSKIFGYTEGTFAFDFFFKLPNGTSTSLHNERGKYLLLDFWGTWCGPCIGALPHLKKIRSAFPPSRFEIIGIAAEQKNDSVAFENFLHQHDIVWPILFQPTHNVPLKKLIPYKFKIQEYPTYLLIDPSGKIIWRGSSEESLSKINNILASIFQ
jgi:thiol-disulfide isomerase/thioredoxin